VVESDTARLETGRPAAPKCSEEEGGDTKSGVNTKSSLGAP